MQLNLPVLEHLQDSDNILIAGAGGGFDIFCGLPIYFTLREMDKTVHLANYSFSTLPLIQRISDPEILVEGTLIGTRGDVRTHIGYSPESYLTEWFMNVRDEEVPVWTFQKVGVKLLHQLYIKLINHLNIDAIIMIDGGVDSLMIGDEEGAGTLLEDTVSLTAVSQLDVPVKILACLGFGAELEVSHHNALMNMAALIKAGAFLGSCALTKQMPVYTQYESACRYVWEQPEHHKSHINMRVVSATQGETGNHHMYHDYRPLEVYVSPLMSLYWFFDADAVNARSLLAPHLKDTVDIQDAWNITMKLRSKKNAINKLQRKLPY
ncbi:MAG: DUF1152 domain-containing protein [Aggregatilineales bacterium]